MFQLTPNIKNDLKGIVGDYVGEEIGLEEQIVILNKKIYDLEQENEILKLNLDSLKPKQEYVVELESKIYQLTKKITELEQENLNSGKGNENKTTEQEYIEKLENKIVEYDEKIASLEKINRIHRENLDKLRTDQSSMVADLEQKIMEQNDYVASLIKENRELYKQLERIKNENGSPNIEENILNLQKRIATLQVQNKELDEKNQVLKAALLLHVDMETTDLSDITIKPDSKKIPEELVDKKESMNEDQIKIKLTNDVGINTSEQIADLPKGKVQELINQRHAALEAREDMEAHSVITEKIIIEKTEKEEEEFPIPLPEQQINVAPTTDTELPNIEEIGVIETTEGRRKCPICGNENLRLIREVEDKTKIISAYPRMYGKKLKCGQCGAEWR